MKESNKILPRIMDNTGRWTAGDSEQQKREQLVWKIREMRQFRREGARLERQVKKVMWDLEKAGGKEWGLQVEEVLHVGSSANGFFGPESDIDLIVVAKKDSYQNTMEFIIKATRLSYAFKIKKVIPKAKTPLITVVHVATARLVDITFDNRRQAVSVRSWLNTQLLFAYNEHNSSLAPVFRVFKQEIEMPGAAKQGLSTYCQLVMFLHYLIKTGQVNQLTTGCFTPTSSYKPHPLVPDEMFIGFLKHLIKLDKSQVIEITTPRRKEIRHEKDELHIADPYISNLNIGRHCSQKNWLYMQSKCKETLFKYGSFMRDE